jgi:thioesterase domain-containing protein
MPFSNSANANGESFGRYRSGPAARVAAPSVAAEPTRRARLEQIAAALRRGEALWIRNQTPVQGSIVAFHDPDEVDKTLLPFFILPSLPQQSTDFIALAGMMDPRQPFFAAYMPSDKRHAATAASVADLAQHYATEIHTLWPVGPIAIGGWSAGPAIALAAAELLRGLGHAVPLLVAVDGAPPSVAIGPPGLFEKTKLTYYRLTNAAVSLTQLGRDVVRRVHRRSPQDASFRGAVRSAWQASAFRAIWQRAAGPIAGKLATRLLRKPVTRHHAADAATDTSGLPPDHRGFVAALYDALHAYVPDADFPGEVVVFESTAEPARSSGGVAKRWARIAPNLTVVPVAGSHMSIVADPDGRPLARLLCQKLREISAQQPGKVRQSAGLPNASMATMTIGKPAYRGDAASPAG